MHIGQKIVSWYAENGRQLPWRNTRDPYNIWISEVILQQTRIAQGTQYYHRFIERFPDITTLANAPIDEVLKYWEGLGYYSRARNLHTAAKQLTEHYNGRFPENYTEIMKLKGLGPYSARAIGSFAFDNPTGVIDGNVLRVMSRVLNCHDPIDSVTTRNAFQAIIDTWVKHVPSAPFNHGIMDIGSTICTPTQPDCAHCPLNQDCLALTADTISLLPFKAKKLKRTTRYFLFHLTITDNQQFCIQKRPESGLWGGLYEIPNEEVAQSEWENPQLQAGAMLKGGFKHVFTHFDMELKVIVHTKIRPSDAFLLWIPLAEREKFAFSRAVLKIFEQFLDT